MNFLDSPPRFLFFTGKGGVGKTSIACASAVSLAEAGRSVLLVSTDPASNVGQVFGIEIGNRITPIPAVPGLAALEIDPQAAAQDYRERIVGPVRGVLPPSAVQHIEEQLSGACTTEIAAFDEFTALLTDNPQTHAYQHIVFDTAPTGHTIRLLQLPGAWNDFLAGGKGDASCLGPLAGLGKQREQYQAAVTALADVAQSRMVLVTRPERAALAEAGRTHAELAAIGLSRQFLVVNGLLPETALADDPLANALHAREVAALAAMPAALVGLPQDRLALKSFNLVGVAALRGLFQPERASAVGTALPPTHFPPLSALVDELAVNQHGLVMVMGKGGVGKTTIAAAIAVRLAALGLPVHLTTSDPAAHLDETLLGSVPSLTLSRIDPHVETARYQSEVMASRGAQLDAAGKALLAEDLRSPCTEEIAVFQAFSRVIREAGHQFVVMDTAPTGHTLLLLDATGAYHRETSRQLGGKGLHFTTPMMQLQDPAQTRVVLVTLAQTTPVQEAADLQADLGRAGIKPWAWVVNNSVAASRPRAPLLRERAAHELPEIAAVAERHAARYAVVPLLAEEPRGVAGLLALSAS